MSAPDSQFLPFPQPMVEDLRRLEQAKMQLVAGFLYGAGLKDRSVRIAADLSGLEIAAPSVDSKEPST